MKHRSLLKSLVMASKTAPESIAGAKAGEATPPPAAPHLRLIDFGSALDAHAMEAMYGLNGPSAAEQTPEYAPPEVVFASRWPGQHAVWRCSNIWPADECNGTFVTSSRC